MSLLRNYSTQSLNREWQAYARDTNSPSYQSTLVEFLEELYQVPLVQAYGRKYPATLYPADSETLYPFEGLCHLTSPAATASEPANEEQKHYLKVLGERLRRPYMTGFYLKKMHLGEAGKVLRIDAGVSDYYQNTLTAHYLEWEAYKNIKRIKEGPASLALDYLPLRRRYHGDLSPHHAILAPANAFPLISVQAMVVFKDYRNKADIDWKIVVVRRPDSTAVAPGRWQFQPAGGFEVYGKDVDCNEDLITRQFDLSRALLQEYAEELFNADGVLSQQDNREVDTAMANEHVQRLLRLVDNGRASMEFLGVVVELAFMRHELSFLIVVDDEEYSLQQFFGSKDESDSFFTERPEAIKTLLVRDGVHSSSAGLLELAMHSNTFRQLGLGQRLA